MYVANGDTIDIEQELALIINAFNKNILAKIDINMVVYLMTIIAF